MGDGRSRAGRGLALLIGAATVAACTASPAPVSTRPVHPTAVAACTDALSKGWTVAVEVDRVDSSALALVSGDSIATCETSKNAERTDFANTATGVGFYPSRPPRTVSYLTSGGTDEGLSYLVGRIPASASDVRLTFPDGSQQDATVGDGLWLAWLEQPSEAAPTTIEAFDAGGTSISRLTDPNGIEPAG